MLSARSFALSREWEAFKAACDHTDIESVLQAHSANWACVNGSVSADAARAGWNIREAGYSGRGVVEMGDRAHTMRGARDATHFLSGRLFVGLNV